jgi:hypothetical protein
MYVFYPKLNCPGGLKLTLSVEKQGLLPLLSTSPGLLALSIVLL